MNVVQKKLRGRPPKATAARDADRQAAIDVVLAILDEAGSAALTARAVADRMGLSTGAVYGLFDSLEALKLEANAVTMRQLRRHLTDALAAVGGSCPTERLLGLAHAYLGFARAHRHAWAAVFDRRTIDLPPALSDDIAALFAIIENVLREVPGLAPRQIGVVAKALWSSVHGMVYLGEMGGLGPVDRDDVPAMIDILVRAAVLGLDGPAHEPRARSAHRHAPRHEASGSSTAPIDPPRRESWAGDRE